VIEIVSPGDESWDKLPFYAAHEVDEALIVLARRLIQSEPLSELGEDMWKKMIPQNIAGH
jgi:hypothetical protein